VADEVGAPRDVSQTKGFFPDQNPNPVLRMAADGTLLYANASAGPIADAWGVAVGQRLPADVAAALRAAAAQSPAGSIEVVHDRRTFDVLSIHVAELDAYNLYGTDITAAKVVERFPGQNPNPVLRMTYAGDLRYANEASRPITAFLGIGLGDPLPGPLLADLRAHLADPAALVPEVGGEGGRTYRLTPVDIPEFEFVNLYATDITAARQVERLNAENERLLLSILPASIAERLRAGETTIADRFDDMTVLFADLVGFTDLSSRLEPDEVVRLLNDVFTLCDRLADEFGLEKIKTVGDAYMVVGGLGEAHAARAGHGVRESHAADVADMALAMLDGLSAYGEAQHLDLQMRVGIQVGPAVAGVIGLKKFIYDVWGDTVNTASRMESTGMPGRIQVTRATRDRLADEFEFESRGLVAVKGKGEIETWFLLGRR
jgi:class 3 adenylate cyclase